MPNTEDFTLYNSVYISFEKAKLYKQKSGPWLPGIESCERGLSRKGYQGVSGDDRNILDLDFDAGQQNYIHLWKVTQGWILPIENCTTKPIFKIGHNFILALVCLKFDLTYPCEWLFYNLMVLSILYITLTLMWKAWIGGFLVLKAVWHMATLTVKFPHTE